MLHMDETTLPSRMSDDSENDFDIPADISVCPCEDELENLPEVLHFIKKLQTFIRKQQSKINKIRRKLIEFKSKKRKMQDSWTQTDLNDEVTGSETEAAWVGSQEVESAQSIAEQVKEAAQSAMQLTGFVYEETSGMYYDYNTGYYYNAELGLYYDGNSGTYYYYDDKTKEFQFHSQVKALPQALPAEVPQSSDSAKQEEDHENKRRLKQKDSKESKKVKLEHDDDGIASGAESVEEGECSDSSGEDGGGSSDVESSHETSHETEEMQEVSRGWPPCMRIIVQETSLEKLQIGTLFLVTYTGGTMGREGDHAVSIPDINISKHHAKFTFDESSGKYFMIDLGSRNGTYLNGKRLSVAKQESDPHEVIHGSTLQVGSTKLLCHIHVGRETCGHCEPGLVQKNKKPPDEKAGSESKKNSHQKELKRIRRKFGLESSDPVPVAPPGYEDRAQLRRTTVGSQDSHEKTQTASLEEPIKSDNKGFKMMMKMGWNEGQALGKNGDGNIDPIELVCRRQKAGLGSANADPTPPEDPASERKKAVWRKTQQRYEKLS